MKQGIEKLSNKILESAIKSFKKTLEVVGDNGENCFTKIDKATLAFLEELKQYREDEEQGLLRRTPVAIGQTVYTNNSVQGWYLQSKNRPYEAEVVYIGLNNSEEMGGGYFNISFKGKKGYMLSFNFNEVGKYVFLTKEEAEKALQDMKESEENT